MAISKPGIASLLLGILLLLGSWYFWFQGAGIWQLLVVILQGGLMLFGLFMVLIGVLMLII
ncbi:MAG: hypothetical protein ABH863_01610 [Candidatus Micrarchaeota archaeon]